MKDENTAPENQQADDLDLNLEDALSQEYDRQAEAGDDIELDAEIAEEADDAQMEVSPQDGEEEPEAHAEGQEEAGEELDAEAAADEAPEYNEPAPERWPEHIRNVYNKLPPAAKKAMLEEVYRPMQRSFTEKTQQMAQQRKSLEPMLQTLQQHAQDFEKSGVNPVEAFNRQMAWSAHFAKVGPEQGAKDLARAYGQDNTGQQDNTQTAYLTPVERQQEARIDRLEGHLTQQQQNNEQRQEQAQQRTEQARTGEVRKSINQFANETRDGKPLHPHVEKVSAEMAGLIRGGLVHRTDEFGQPVPFDQQLGQAYQLACEMDPSIRGARNTRTRKEQVNKVRAAGREVVSKTPGRNTRAPDEGPLSDSISDLYDRLDRSVA